MENTDSSFCKKQVYLERIYSVYNDAKYVHPDPLEFVLASKTPEDMEITGLIASSYAYGRVGAIISTVDSILSLMEYRPYDCLIGSDKNDLAHSFENVKYRFTSSQETVSFLFAIKKIIEKYSSLHDCFCSCMSSNDKNYGQAALRFSSELYRAGDLGDRSSLLPITTSVSPCKRLMLFLRWMIRKDCVDPGCWADLDTSKLIVPLDTHMHKIGRMLNMTESKNSNMKTAVEITDAFSKYSQTDPVKYDFALTRSGIRGDNFIDDFASEWNRA